MAYVANNKRLQCSCSRCRFKTWNKYPVTTITFYFAEIEKRIAFVSVAEYGTRIVFAIHLFITLLRAFITSRAVVFLESNRGFISTCKQEFLDKKVSKARKN